MNRAVEARQVHGPRIGAQSLFAGGIVVILEVAQRQLAQGQINRLARAQSGIVRFSHRAPAPVRAIDGDHVIGIANGFEVHHQRRESQAAQSHRREQRAFHAVRDALFKHSPRRIARGAAGFAIVADFLIEESLDFGGRSQLPEDGPLTGVEGVRDGRTTGVEIGAHFCQTNVVLYEMDTIGREKGVA